MVYYNNVLCVEKVPLVKAGVIKDWQWKEWQEKGARIVRKGGNGRTSLMELNTIPIEYQSKIREVLNNDGLTTKKASFKDYVVIDENAISFFSNYKLEDGRILGTLENGKYLKEYSANANYLNALHKIYTNENEGKKALGNSIKGFWPKASEVINNNRVEYVGSTEIINHTLPTSWERLQKTYNLYIKGGVLKLKQGELFVKGYEALISKKFCNDNTLKVNAHIESLLLSLYTRPNKPFGFDVFTDYQRFLDGKIELSYKNIDKDTGEVIGRYFTPDQFKNNKGEFITLSESTVWNWLNKPVNRAIVDSMRNGQFEFNNHHRPHHHRNAPTYSFSKISLDDRDLPRKCTNGGRVKAYYSYDVASGCVIGYSYSMSKDEELFLECLRNQFRTIEAQGWGMPLEVEVENHLVNKFFDDLALMFPFIRICNPGNSQEKRAEHFNRAKKYGIEKKTQNGIGRWWAKSEAYRIDQPKSNDEFVEKVFTYESLIADDIAAIKAYNNALHPKQKKYPGRTRWQVLCENMNPKVAQVSKPVVYKAIGEKTKTSIRRNQYCKVKYAEYVLSSPQIVDKLEPNNYEVEAYYLPNNDGIITEVYLYQGSQYLCKCERINKYNEAKAEWETGIDETAYTQQAAYVSQFDKMVKEGKANLAKVTVSEASIIQEASEEKEFVLVESVSTEETISDILNSFDAADYEAKALEDF